MNPSADVWHGEKPMFGSSWLRRLLTEPLRARTWREFAYAVIGLPIGVVGFVFTAVTLSLSVGLLITFVGLPLLAVSGVVSRWLGGRLRGLSNTLVETAVVPAAPFRHEPGVFGWLAACLKDGAAWRARLYLVLRLPTGILGFVIAIAFWTYGLGALTYWSWRPFLPCQAGTDGRCHRGTNFGNSYYLDTAPRVALVALAGVLLLFAAPWAVRAVLMIDRVLVQALLGPTGSAQRVAELERTRAVAVDESAATLRRIERDLHDGTQARLVALAMNVGLAREKLAEGDDPAGAARLLDRAHETAKDAIVELRDLARGIHPPVLDAGLDAALATLAAHSAVPITVTTSITERPDPAIETMAYFCAAELITNIAKHSGAGHGAVHVGTAGGRLRLAVSDDGHGGARIGAGTGLAGLAERVATVDGGLTVTSPDGGPTTITIDVPLHVPAAR
ncbi:MAG TPA: sensor domain-containing protein [Jatrophihabitans sp.]|nr:sensor domain-containing protein [Jatrophihabitans sp.]